MATAEFSDLVRSIGVEPTSITVSQNPLCVRDEIKIEGYLRPLEQKMPTIGEWAKVFCSKPKSQFSVKKILKNGDYMTVLWADGTKTIVKRAADEPQSDYAAFTAALGIKAFGSNSALKRIVAGAEEQGKKKKKKQSEGEILRGLEDIKEGNRAAYKHDNRG